MSTFRKNYTKDYRFYSVPNENGRGHRLIRFYTGAYYRQIASLTEIRHGKGKTVAFLLIYFVAAIIAGIQPGPANSSLIGSVSGIATLVVGGYPLIGVFNLLVEGADLKNFEYQERRRKLMAAPKVAVALAVMAALCQVLFFIFSKSEPHASLTSCIISTALYLVCSVCMLFIYKTEGSRTYEFMPPLEFRPSEKENDLEELEFLRKLDKERFDQQVQP